MNKACTCASSKTSPKTSPCGSSKTSPCGSSKTRLCGSTKTRLCGSTKTTPCGSPKTRAKTSPFSQFYEVAWSKNMFGFVQYWDKSTAKGNVSRNANSDTFFKPFTDCVVYTTPKTSLCTK